MRKHAVLLAVARRRSAPRRAGGALVPSLRRLPAEIFRRAMDERGAKKSMSPHQRDIRGRKSLSQPHVRERYQFVAPGKRPHPQMWEAGPIPIRTGQFCCG